MIVEILLIVGGILLTAIGLTWPINNGPFYNTRVQDHILPVTFIASGVTLICTAAYLVIT